MSKSPPGKKARKPRQYRVYLVWEQTVDDPHQGMEALLTAPQKDRQSVELMRSGRITITANRHSLDFLLVDDPQFAVESVPAASSEVYLKVVRRMLFGKERLEAVPLGEPPPGYMLSGRTGRFVAGGLDFVRDLSPQPVPLRYWVPATARTVKRTSRK